MEEVFLLLSPFLRSVKNSITGFSRSLYKKILFYAGVSSLFIILITILLNLGMAKLQGLSPDVFQALLIKGYSLIFLIIFFLQVLNGMVISLDTFYHSKDLEILLVSPINRTSLFLSKLIETHIKTSLMLVIFGLPLLISVGTLYKAGLLYYLYAIILFIPFSIVPVNAGIGATIFMAGFFQARKLKKVMLSAGIIFAALLLTLIRLFRPEQFVNPELFANLTLFVTELKTPSFILLPNRWLSESIFDFLDKTFTSNTVIFISLLFLTAYITILALHMVYKRYHYRGWGLLQEGGTVLGKAGINLGRLAPLQKKTLRSKGLQLLMSLPGIRSNPLIKKDLLCQLRDSGTIQQLVVVLSLTIIYLFSVASLPLNWAGYFVQLKYIVSFFNLGLMLIIIAALCSRIIYFGVVSEGTSLWLLKTSPLTSKRYVRTKFLLYFIPTAILGQLLTAFSAHFIGVEKAFLLLNSITVLFLTLSFVSLSINFGISALKHSSSEALEEQVRVGSTYQMLISVFLILFTLALEAFPVFIYFSREQNKAVFTEKAFFIIGTTISILFLVNIIVTGLAIRLSIKKIDNLPGN